MIQARPVEGRFRRLRWWANTVLIAILVGIPWIRIGGEPLVLLDVPARKFHVFGLVIAPQELYFLWLILAGLALSLFFFTALAGRLWCGWACPQTVFTDVYATLGRWIQGWRGVSPPREIPRWRHVATHAAWIGLSVLVGFHLAGYFRSPYELLHALDSEHHYPTALAFIGAVSVVTYLDFAWVRQTFCKYLCPYARFQGVLFDRDTLVIGYDERRGEPRGKKGSVTGDCVDCGLCVAVCPTGIDIRHGLQLECIACTQCIDACNGVMDQLGRARNLIGYAPLVQLQGLRPGRLLRPRVVLYGALLLAVGVAFGTLLERRLPMDLRITRNPTSLYTTTADGRVGNAFTLHIENRSRSEAAFELALLESEDFELVMGLNPVTVPATSTSEARVFVLARPGRTPKPSEIHLQLQMRDTALRPIVRPARFVVPGGTRAH